MTRSGVAAHEARRTTRLEWQPAGGLQREVCTLTDFKGLTADVGSATPIRVPVFYRGQSGKPGYYWMASLRRHVTHESKAERTYLMEADWAGTVTGVLPQPFRFHFPRDERPFRHIPDFLVQRDDGTLDVVDVKGARQREKPLNRLTFDLTRKACDELGFSFVVYSGPEAITEANLAFLAGYRGTAASALDEYLPLLVDLVAAEEPQVVEVNERLTRAGVLPAVAPATVWRAMWKRLLVTDFLSPLTLTARVRLATPITVGGAA